MVQKRFLALTLAVFVLAIAAISFASKEESVKDVFPMIGSASAKADLLVVEELNCPHCKEFQLNILPQIRKEYINSGKVKCRFVLVAYKKESIAQVEVALAVSIKAPDRFEQFLEELFKNPKIKGLQIAEKLGIDVALVEQALQDGSAHDLLERSVALAEKLMGDDLAVPTVYLNGKDLGSPRLNELQESLNEV